MRNSQSDFADIPAIGLPENTAFLDLPHNQLNLNFTLGCGQTFRWKVDNEGWWSAPYADKVIRIREFEGGFLWQTIPGEPDFSIVLDCFRLDEDILAIYDHLSRCDDYVAMLVEKYRGLRIIRQKPEDTLFSFICSAANSVCRISTGIEELSRRYGRFIVEVGGVKYYSFPGIDSLANADLGEISRIPCLYWRGGFVGNVARSIMSRNAGWFELLRSMDYLQAKAELMALKGVGEKVADCVCLFSLDKNEAVPVDTHIRRIASRLYLTDMNAKTLTSTVYKRIAEAIRDKFGPYAGWAQQFLYYDELLNWSGRSKKRG
jgi:N-glycosylase/DNA lyase